MNLDAVKFDERGLVPVVIQDADSGEVLTLAWANREALERTLQTGQTHLYSRSRQALWKKGETSGHVQDLVEMRLDCDGDAVLYRVRPHGPACHTGARSCFHNPVTPEATPPLGWVLEQVWRTIQDRLETMPEGSYVAKMHAAGLDRILKKIGEEAGEVIIAAKNPDAAELAWEASDLLFHLLLTLAERGLGPADLARVLSERHQPGSEG
ncbi:phosphoribosyl-AMP cyclohydrolase; phosphoribosyl-ATP pyrophosphatase [Oceanithermus profundus DSM 14977]|uniref:Histidine biosynthesis bifunctional protein HisIE n=1 Tax=Oceanithermus profundus (strain DSM 14977 / NBRC 100410 / VKM B-2274 / 506) TaxID=670487 RepID=E4U8S7_OCEP5|nr:bifunctional phosphoribosyl-AMP cyclohydrolase/phosphoribosyl-ATP diphosphatase HisIE [Oceanithermus profundus]ADR36757.1 phosphoribosyl-AMP cyclohydrolase; phosphoribosyl-ATP pyrophosphatase [Oceanithermus profundus DSM 14977]